MLYILIITLITILLGVYIAYKQSNRIMYRKNKRHPVENFPSDYGLDFDKVSFINEDGITLKGWFIPAKEHSEKTIIFLHGWGLNKGSILPTTYFLRDYGFNLFYFDFRGSGDSGDGLSSIGYLEIRDAEAAVKTVKQLYPQQAQKLGIYGLSMGGAVAVYEGAHNKYIQCVVAEGCYYSYEKVVARWARVHKHTPYFPLVALTLFFARKRLGLNPEQFSPKHNIKKLKGKPLFLINGSDDTLAPRHDARKLFAAAEEPKQMWIVANAAHTQSAMVAGKQYQNRLAEFFTKYLY